MTLSSTDQIVVEVADDGTSGGQVLVGTRGVTVIIEAEVVVVVRPGITGPVDVFADVTCELHSIPLSFLVKYPAVNPIPNAESVKTIINIISLVRGLEQPFIHLLSPVSSL